MANHLSSCEIGPLARGLSGKPSEMGRISVEISSVIAYRSICLTSPPPPDILIVY